jgi:hypothetical protein
MTCLRMGEHYVTQGVKYFAATSVGRAVQGREPTLSLLLLLLVFGLYCKWCYGVLGNVLRKG